MNLSWKLGRVAGIDLYLHPTFLLLLAYAGTSGGGLTAVLLTSAAFGCVLLHELGHALTARRFGIRTENITLYPIGGVARLERLPRAPGAELLIALAGPAVNLLIAAGLWLGLNLGLDILAGPTLSWFASTLLAINLVLAVFNLIPAFPMDGGRVLRALLSGWLGRARATLIAAGLGRGLAIAFGVYCLLNGMLLQAFLAGFIYLAAGSELRRVLAEEAQQAAAGLRGQFPPLPPGFQWVYRGGGLWRPAPVAIPVPAQGQAQARPWP